MKVSSYPIGKVRRKCLVLVGGSGDTIEGFSPMTTQIIQKLPDYSICSFNFSKTSNSESLLDGQAQELGEVFEQLATHHNFEQIDIFATSMGAYATIKLLSNNQYNHLIKNVIFYDPADYYLSARFAGSDDVTWSGPQSYTPTGKVVSTELLGIRGDYLISIVHLTLRNYGLSGYLDSNYSDRGINHADGYPRLNTDMVKSMYAKIPLSNRGKYIEELSVPHAFLRDGNISANLDIVSKTIENFLK